MDLDPLQNRLRDLRRRCPATKVRRHHRSLAQHGIHCGLDPGCGVAVAQVAEHHRSRANGGDWVGLVLASNVRCGAVYPVHEFSRINGLDGLVGNVVGTYGSPITNVSPAFTEGTTPRDPTRAAAASLRP
jgi:hypothetical protein